MAASVVLAQGNPPTRMLEDVAIFTVRHEGKTFSIDPVVIVHYGADQRFKTIPALNSPLPSRHWTEADFGKIENSFYRRGTVIGMFSGGESFDGQDEVITLASHYEGWSYAVWKFYANAGTWKEKYKGIGGGC